VAFGALAFAAALWTSALPAQSGSQEALGDAKRGSVEWQAFMGTADDSAREGDADLALAGYRRALEFAEEDWQFAITHMRLGQGYLAKGELEDAVRELEAARLYAQTDETDAVPHSDLLAALIEAYSRNGQDVKAIETAVELKAVDPGHPAVLGIAMGAPMAPKEDAPAVSEPAAEPATPKPASKPAPRSTSTPSAKITPGDAESAP
jgi:tetratricopeptide (TPR) repeat protein